MSSEKTYRNSPYCAGSNTTFQPACGNADDVIAVESIQHGTKQKSTCGLLDKSAVCCQYDSGDCLFPYTADATSSLFVECSGKQMCQGSYPAAVETPTCDSNYTSYSHYYTMEYYCLPGKYILNAKNLAPPFLSIFFGSKSMTSKINVL